MTATPPNLNGNPAFRPRGMLILLLTAVWGIGLVTLVCIEGPLMQRWHDWLLNDPPRLVKILRQTGLLAEVPFLVALGAVLTLYRYWQARRQAAPGPQAIRQAGNFLLLYAVCGLASVSIPNLFKVLIPRLRPRAFEAVDAWHSFLYSGQAPLPWKFSADWQSFPSAHTAAAFCMTMAIVCTWPSRWVKLLVYPLALLVGFSRVLRQMHFPSDVWTGMALGLILGLMACQVLRRLAETRSTSQLRA